jgi:hypothetical protein
VIIGGYGDRVSARGLGLVALATVVGVAGGYAYADSSLGAPDAGGTPSPVAAAGPAFPTTPQVKTLPDSDLPPLATQLATTTATLGKPPLGIQFPVPVGWPRFQLAAGQVRYTAPGDPEAAYSVRIAPLQVTQSAAQMVAAKVAQLPLDSRISDLHFDEQTDDTLVFTYILAGHRIEQVIRWVSFNGGPAVAEIAASGRLVDDPGMRTLTAVMVAGTERQPPKPKKSARASTDASTSASTRASPGDTSSPSSSSTP